MTKVAADTDSVEQDAHKMPEFSTVKGGQSKTADVSRSMDAFLAESEASQQKSGKAE